MTDDWSGLANFLTDMIEKYAEVLDIDNLSLPEGCKNVSDILVEDGKRTQKAVAKNDAA